MLNGSYIFTGAPILVDAELTSCGRLHTQSSRPGAEESLSFFVDVLGQSLLQNNCESEAWWDAWTAKASPVLMEHFLISKPSHVSNDMVMGHSASRNVWCQQQREEVCSRCCEFAMTASHWLFIPRSLPYLNIIIISHIDQNVCSWGQVL